MIVSYPRGLKIVAVLETLHRYIGSRETTASPANLKPRDEMPICAPRSLLCCVAYVWRAQVFTNLGAQECGEFMRGSDPMRPMGHCIGIVYRSWAFLQRQVQKKHLRS